MSTQQPTRVFCPLVLQSALVAALHTPITMIMLACLNLEFRQVVVALKDPEQSAGKSSRIEAISGIGLGQDCPIGYGY